MLACLRVTSQLVKHDVIALEAIWPHLAEEDETQELEQIMKKKSEMTKFHYTQTHKAVISKTKERIEQEK